MLAQRLVRTLCPACRVARAPTAGEAQLLAELGVAAATPSVTAPRLRRSASDTGYRGRTGVYELLRRRRRDPPR